LHPLRHEIEDLVPARDVAQVAQRLERSAGSTVEIEGYLVHLGCDGRLLGPSSTSYFAGYDRARTGRTATTSQRSDAAAVNRRRHFAPGRPRRAEPHRAAGSIRRSPRLSASAARAETLDSSAPHRVDTGCLAQVRGRRNLSSTLVEHGGGFQKLARGLGRDLQAVEGVGETLPATYRRRPVPPTESSILERTLTIDARPLTAL